MEGHKYGVYCLAIKESNKTMFSGSADNSIGVWACKSRKLERKLESHVATVSGLILSKNEQFLFSISKDNTVLVWLLKKYEVTKRLSCFSASNFQKTLALSDQYYTLFGRDKKHHNKLRIVNLISDETVRLMRVHAKKILCITIAPDDDHFFTGGADGVINVFDVENANLVRAITSHKQAVNCLEVSKDCRFLASASDDKTVALFDCDNMYRPIYFFEHTVEVSSLVFSKNNQRLLTGGWHYKPIKVWNIAFLNINYDEREVHVPGRFFLGQSAMNRKTLDHKSTHQRMQEKVLNFAQGLNDLNDLTLARRSLAQLNELNQLESGVPIDPDRPLPSDAKVANELDQILENEMEDFGEGFEDNGGREFDDIDEDWGSRLGVGEATDRNSMKNQSIFKRSMKSIKRPAPRLKRKGKVPTKRKKRYGAK